MGRQFVITSFQLAEETTLKSNTIENNFPCILYFTPGWCIWNPVLWNGLVLSINFFQQEFWLLCNQSGKRKMPPNKIPDVSAEKTVCPCWCEAGEEIRIQPLLLLQHTQARFLLTRLWDSSLHFECFISYQEHNVTVNLFSAPAPSLQTLSLSSVLQKGF